MNGLNKKRLWVGVALIVTVVAVVFATRSLLPQTQWYRDRYADEIFEGIFDNGILPKRIPQSETDLVAPSYIAALGELPALMIKSVQAQEGLTEDAAPALVRLFVDKNRSDFARGEAANALTIPLRRKGYSSCPNVDYKGILRVLRDSTEEETIRSDAIRLLVMWQYEEAIPYIRAMIRDTSVPDDTRKTAIRELTALDKTAQGLPEEIFDEALSMSARLDWFDYANRITLTDAEIDRLENLLRKDLSREERRFGLQNAIVGTLGNQKSPVASRVLGSALHDLIRGTGPTDVTAGLLVRSLVKTGTHQADELILKTVAVAEEIDKEYLLDEISENAAEARFSKMSELNRLIEDAHRRHREAHTGMYQ